MNIALIKPLEWTEHQEDGCPVQTSAFVDVRYRDGDFSMCVAAGGLPWSKTGTYCDIVAFRVVPPPNVKSAAADDIKAAYFEGFLAGCDRGESTGKQYAEKNWPFSQAQSDHERTLMAASAVDTDLVSRLREGVSIAGETDSGADLYDIDGAETTMAEAADALSAMGEATHILSVIEREIGNWECDGPDEMPTTVSGLIEAERAIYRAALSKATTP